MKDNLLRICLVSLVAFLLSFRLVSEIKREIDNRKMWTKVFKVINRWDLEEDQLYWESVHWEPNGRSYIRDDTLFIVDEFESSWIYVHPEFQTRERFSHKETLWVDTNFVDIIIFK